MGNVAVIQDAESPLGNALCQDLLDRGWIVFGGGETDALNTKYPTHFTALAMDPQSLVSIGAAVEVVANTVDHVDLLICNADRFEQDMVESLNFKAIERLYDINAVGPIRFLESFLPLTETGIKRFCFITDPRGSIGVADHGDNLGYSMSKSALHMTVMILFNHLGKAGYTFRLYIPGSLEEPSATARSAGDYFIADRDDEDRLTIVNANGEEWPF